MVQREVIPTTPVRIEYRLTEKGESLSDIIHALAAGAEEWVELPALASDGA